MKLVFDKKGLVNAYGYERVIAIPTTKKEKLFFSIIKDEKGNYRPWVYNSLFRFDDKILDNPFVDDYDENGNLLMDNSGAYIELVDELKLDEMNWNKEAYDDTSFEYLIKPSNFCILSLYYYLFDKIGKMRRMKHLYNRMIEMSDKQSCFRYFTDEGDDMNDIKE